MKIFVSSLLVCTALALTQNLHAQGTAFTYQGRLNSSGSPTSGLYDFRFRLDADPAGNTILGTVLTNAIPVTNGLFTTTIDFGPGWFNGSNYWLEVDVRTNTGGSGSYTVLNPFQPLTPTPYAVFANTASNVSGPVSTAQLSGAVASANLSGTYGNAVTLNNPGNSFSGNGANVSNVNATALGGLAAGNFWQLGGNNVSPGQIIGSTNNQPLEFRTGGQRVLLLSPSATDAPNILGGAPVNMVDPGVQGAVIAGGGTTNFLGTSSSNRVSANFGSIGGGSGNWIQSGSDHSGIGGGWMNLIATNTYESVIAGGENNTMSSSWSFIGGGFVNTNSGQYGTIGGGYQNNNSGYLATLGGGTGNANAGVFSVIGGGEANNIQGFADHSTISGGGNNVIVGSVLSVYSTIGGGASNTIPTNSIFSTVGGGLRNTAQGQSATVAGGQDNISIGNFAAIGGGQSNFTGNSWAVIGGGDNNTNAGNAGTLAGGQNNNMTGGAQPVIGGGYGNNINASYGTIGGGLVNTNNSLGATIGGGGYNLASGLYGTIPGGYSNVANGAYAFAAGLQARALNQGAFVWADSQGTAFSSTANDQFLVRSQGGMGINMNNPNGASLYVAGNRTNSWQNSMSFFENSGTGTNDSPALRVFADGSTPAGALSVSTQGSGLIAQFGNGVAFVSQLDVNGNWTANSFSGNGGGLTSLSAANLSGALPAISGASLTSLNASQLISIGNTNGSAQGNFFIGPSGNSFASGVNNTANGSQSLAFIFSGSFNTANGTGALGYDSSGSYNTAIGASTISGIAFHGSNNIALGYNAGSSFTGGESGNIDIGNVGTTSENNIIRIGSGQTSTFIAGIINGNGGGLTSLNAANLSGALPAISGASLTSLNASQLISIGNTNGSAQGNFFIGPSGNSFASGVNNTANGSQSLAFIFSGSFNTANGTGALGYDSSGSYNTAIGASTISGIAFHGSNNIALGYNAGSSFTGGESGNIDIGNVGTTSENNIIRIGSGQTSTFIAGIINGNGGGLTNLGAAQLSGSVPVGVSMPAADLTGALPAISGASLTSLPAANLTGALPAISGANLTSLNASAIASGTIPLARLPALNLVNVSGALTASTSYTVSGDTTGGINSAVALVINNDTNSGDAPALRVIGNGGENSGVLSVSSQNFQRTGLIAQFGNSNAFVVTITNDGTIYCKATVLSSDRNLKENFQALDVRSVLDKLAALPVTEWNYKDDAADKKHIGPMAQDFYAAFGLDGNDDKHISTVDEGGVALAAIQGLNQKLTEKDARIQEQGDEIAELKSRLGKLEQLMNGKNGGTK